MKPSCACAAVLLLAWLLIHPIPAHSDIEQQLPNDDRSVLKAPLAPGIPDSVPEPVHIAGARKRIRAYVTGYNTVAEQTDSTPCSAAGGKICGRQDTVACPTSLPLHSKVRISGKVYECMDRTAGKHDGRFDISCDKDTSCPARVTGWRTVTLL